MASAQCIVRGCSGRGTPRPHADEPEAFAKGDKGGNERPAQERIDQAPDEMAEVELVAADAAEEEGKDDSDGAIPAETGAGNVTIDPLLARLGARRSRRMSVRRHGQRRRWPPRKNDRKPTLRTEFAGARAEHPAARAASSTVHRSLPWPW